MGNEKKKIQKKTSMENLKRKVKKEKKDDEWRNGNRKGKQEGRIEKEERIGGKKRIKRIQERK